MNLNLSSLNDLAERVPSFNSSSCYSELDKVLAQYINILNSINSSNSELKRSTNLYYNDISDIRSELQISLYAKKYDDKVAAYESASRNLRSNILALAYLIDKNVNAQMATA